MAQFVQLTYQKAFRTAFRLTGRAEDAEDACQNAFMRFFSSLKDFKRKSSLTTWFYRIVVNSSIDIVRARKGKGIPLDEKRSSLKEEHSPLARVLNDELGQKIQEAITILPPQQRAVFILKHFNGLRLREIAGILRISPGTAKSHLFRAIANLQESLKEYMEE